MTEKPLRNPLLKMRTVKRREHFLFNLLCFLYFRKSAAYSIESRPVGALIIVPYVLFAEAYFLQSLRYFVTIDQRIVGLVAYQENKEALFISVLATHPFYRKMGVASFMLNYAVKLAKKLDRRSIELAVLKRNQPAMRLYEKIGFRLKGERRQSYILTYQV